MQRLIPGEAERFKDEGRRTWQQHIITVHICRRNSGFDVTHTFSNRPEKHTHTLELSDLDTNTHSRMNHSHTPDVIGCRSAAAANNIHQTVHSKLLREHTVCYNVFLITCVMRNSFGHLRTRQEGLCNAALPLNVTLWQQVSRRSLRMCWEALKTNTRIRIL